MLPVYMFSSVTQSSNIIANVTQFVHPEYLYSLPDWTKVRDCLSGERRIKERAQTYLPMLEGMSATEYQEFLDRASYFNATKRTLEGWMGSLFRKEPVFTSIPDWLLESASDDGDIMRDFSERVAKEVVGLGRVGILTDMAQDGDPDNEPYMTMYSPEQILNWGTEKINGKNQLAQVLLFEIVSETMAFGISLSWRYQYRALKLEVDPDGSFVYVQYIWGPDDVAADNSSGSVFSIPPTARRIVPTKRGVPFSYIPFVFIGTSSLRPQVEVSPLLDIVQLNLAHYVVSADLQHGRKFTALPTYWVKGAAGDTNATYKVGPNTVWLLGQDDEAGILEFKGEGLKYLESAIIKFESQMNALGAKLLVQQQQTAAQSDYMSEQAEASDRASLADISFNLDTGMTQAVQNTLRWTDMPEAAVMKATVEFNKNFKEQDPDARQIRAVQALWQQHGVPLEVMFNVLKSSDMIPSYMTYEDYKKLLTDPTEVAPQIQPPSPFGGGGPPPNVKKEPTGKPPATKPAAA